MTLEDRIKRDGDRWRYIYLLEGELDKRRTRQVFVRASLAVNVLLIALVIWMAV